MCSVVLFVVCSSTLWEVFSHEVCLPQRCPIVKSMVQPSNAMYSPFKVFVLPPCDRGPVWLSADNPSLCLLPPHLVVCCADKSFFQNCYRFHMLTCNLVIVAQRVAVVRWLCTQAAEVWESAHWQLVKACNSSALLLLGVVCLPRTPI